MGTEQIAPGVMLPGHAHSNEDEILFIHRGEGTVVVRINATMPKRAQPLIGLSAIAATRNIYAGLWYPVIVAGITFIVGTLLLRETRQVKIWDELVEKRRLEVMENA